MEKQSIKRDKEEREKTTLKIYWKNIKAFHHEGGWK